MSRHFKTVDHEAALDTTVRLRDCLPPEVCTQLLLLAQASGVLQWGTISLDGTKIHADASKSKAVSYQRLLELETHLRVEVDELLAQAAQADAPPLPDGLVLADEVG